MKEMDGHPKETTRVGVFVCHCGINIGGVVKVPEVVQYAKTLPTVVHAEENLYTCSSEGLNRIKEAIKEYDLNRVVVASCTPRTHEPIFRDTCEEAGLNKYLFEMANIRDQCSWVHMHEPERATQKARELVKMAVAKARLLRPQEELEIDIKPSCLVIGGGIAGMTAANCIAHQGFRVYLVEKEPELGGMLRQLHRVYPTNNLAADIVQEAFENVTANENISISKSTAVKDVEGFIGNFDVTVENEDGEAHKLEVGTIIVATGATNFEPVGLYGYKKYKNVITQIELENLFRAGQFEKPEKIVMIQCVGAREEKGRTYCSRICCMTALKNAMYIKELYPDTDVYVLLRDLQAYGKEYGKYQWKSREKGIKFIKYDPKEPPEVTSERNGKLTVNVYHANINEEIEISCDLIVLSTPLVQHEAGRELSQILKIPIGSDGFFLEAHVKLRPVDFATDGIFVCGTAHSPKDIGESITQACAAASRATIPMANKRVRTAAITAFVDEDLCIGCGRCVEVCPSMAIELRKEDGYFKAHVNAVLCKGCGTCVSVCPNWAIRQKHFENSQILAMIDAMAVEAP